MKSLWIVFGSYTFTWGLWLFSPFWHVFSTRSGIYDQMADFMPEWAWGLHAMVVGIAIVYGAMFHWPRGLMIGRIVGSYHWGLIAVFYALGDWHNTGMITCAFLVVFLNMMWYSSKRCAFKDVL